MIKKLCDSLDCKNDKFRFIAPNACIILAYFLWVRYHFGRLTQKKGLAFASPFFIGIRLRRVMSLRGDLRPTQGDIALRAGRLPFLFAAAKSITLAVRQTRFKKRPLQKKFCSGSFFGRCGRSGERRRVRRYPCRVYFLTLKRTAPSAKKLMPSALRSV